MTVVADDDPLVKEKAMLDYVLAHGSANSVSSVIAAIDDFCAQPGQFMMHLGATKGGHVDAALVANGTTVYVEFGMYVGYSALRAAAACPEAKLICIEPHAGRANIALKVLDFAGVSDRVTWLEGTSGELIPGLKERVEEIVGTPVEAIEGLSFLIDHVKEAYLPDLKACMDAGLIPEGAVVIADNILFPGAPEYREFVESCEEFDSQFFLSHLENKPHIPDGVLVAKRVSPSAVE